MTRDPSSSEPERLRKHDIRIGCYLLLIGNKAASTHLCPLPRGSFIYPRHLCGERFIEPVEGALVKERATTTGLKIRWLR